MFRDFLLQSTQVRRSSASHDTAVTCSVTSSHLFASCQCCVSGCCKRVVKGNWTIFCVWQDDYECTTRLISPTSSLWSDDPGAAGDAAIAAGAGGGGGGAGDRGATSGSSSHVFELIHCVRQWHNQHSAEGPIIVIDRYVINLHSAVCEFSPQITKIS